MQPTLRRAAGDANEVLMPKITAAENFSFFQQVVPGLFFFVGVTPCDRDVMDAAPNHSRQFFVDESGLELGLRVANLVCDFLEAPAASAG